VTDWLEVATVVVQMPELVGVGGSQLLLDGEPHRQSVGADLNYGVDYRLRRSVLAGEN
jgi:hypothetical protein